MDNKKDVVITYETLFDILRREKSRDELQELPASFFYDLMNYINEKNEFISKNKENIFSDDEADKANKQMQNIKRIIKEIYNRRERKIVDMAINKAVTGSSLIDTSKLLEDEKKIYDLLLNVLVDNRKDLIESVLLGKGDFKEPVNVSKVEYGEKNKQESGSLEQEKPQEVKQEPAESAQTIENPVEATKPAQESLNPAEKAKELKNNPNFEDNKAENNVENSAKIRILEHVPQFIGPDLEVLGPFEKDQEHNVDPKIADILINSNKAQII